MIPVFFCFCFLFFVFFLRGGGGGGAEYEQTIYDISFAISYHNLAANLDMCGQI